MLVDYAEHAQVAVSIRGPERLNVTAELAQRIPCSQRRGRGSLVWHAAACLEGRRERRLAAIRVAPTMPYAAKPRGRGCMVAEVA